MNLEVIWRTWNGLLVEIDYNRGYGWLSYSIDLDDYYMLFFKPFRPFRPIEMSITRLC